MLRVFFALLMMIGSAFCVDDRDSLDIEVRTFWQSPGNWKRSCILELTNKGSDLHHIKVQFDLPQGMLRQISGRKNFLLQDNTVISYPLENLPFPSNQRTYIPLEIFFPDGKGVKAGLPKNFQINEVPVEIKEEQKLPTPQDLSLLELHPSNALCQWKIPDETGQITEYEVFYHSFRSEESQQSFKTQARGYHFLYLEPGTRYQIQVRSLDKDSHFSPFSEPFVFETPEVSFQLEEKSRDFLAVPYVDALAYPTPDLQKLIVRSGVLGTIAGFVVGLNRKACWGGFATVYDSNTGQVLDGDATVSTYHREAFVQFPDALISIGGASGLPPCADPSLTPQDLKNIYKGMIDNYHLKGLDFDFEGAFLADRQALSRHLQGINLLLKEKPDIRILYTLPVDGSPGLQGFNWYGVDFLKMVQQTGTYPFAIQCMLMEFGAGSSFNLFEASKIALEGAYTQLKSIFGQPKGKWTDQDIWNHMGAVPMFGRNNNGKVFTLQDQRDLNKYCLQKEIKIMSGWDMIRDTRMSPQDLGVPDHKPYAFSEIIAQYH